jgi:hypothetical protein
LAPAAAAAKILTEENDSLLAVAWLGELLLKLFVISF